MILSKIFSELQGNITFAGFGRTTYKNAEARTWITNQGKPEVLQSDGLKMFGCKAFRTHHTGKGFFAIRLSSHFAVIATVAAATIVWRNPKHASSFCSASSMLKNSFGPAMNKSSLLFISISCSYYLSEREPLDMEA